jgi:hypothetical protein
MLLLPTKMEPPKKWKDHKTIYFKLEHIKTMQYKKQLLFIIGLLFCVFNSVNLKAIDWKDKPTLHNSIKADWLKKSAVIIKEDIKKVFQLDDSKQRLEVLYTMHKIVRVNDEKGLEIFNKAQVRYSDNYELKNIQARVITPSGNVIALPPTAFKDQQTDGNVKTKLFAFEGAEIGSELEYMYTISMGFDEYGTYRMQDEFPTLSSSFEIVSLPNMKFEMKTYGDIKIIKDTADDEKRYLIAQVQNMDGIEEEPMAAYLAHFARLEYKLAYNLKSPGVRLNTWNDAAKNIYNNYYTFTDKEKDLIKVITEDREFKALTGTEQKIIWIENNIKSKYFVNDGNLAQDASEIKSILKNKLTTEYGLKRLFTLALLESKIKFEFGFTSNRFQKAFDYSFDNIENLDNMLIYFPETKKFLAPLESFYRYPFFPATWGLQDGLFVKVVSLGSYSSALPEKRYIDLASHTASSHNHFVTLNFNTEMDTIVVKTTAEFKGHNAVPIIPVFAIQSDKEKMEEVVKQLIQIDEAEEKVTDMKWENGQFETLSTDKPLRVSGTTQSTSIIEKAGNKYIVNIGTVIGKQSELYDTKKRQYDVDMNEPHQLLRTIRFTVPKGYTISNPADCKLNFIAKNTEKEFARFVSDYTMEGDEIVISIEEIYYSPIVKLAYFEELRKVINAAADFNKVKFVLVKK